MFEKDLIEISLVEIIVKKFDMNSILST